MTGVPVPGRAAPGGPSGTPRQARAAWLRAAEGGAGSGMTIPETNRADLAAALSAIPAGAWDERVAGWPARQEPQIVAAVTSWVRRARLAGKAGS